MSYVGYSSSHLHFLTSNQPIFLTLKCLYVCFVASYILFLFSIHLQRTHPVPSLPQVAVTGTRSVSSGPCSASVSRTAATCTSTAPSLVTNASSKVWKALSAGVKRWWASRACQTVRSNEIWRGMKVKLLGRGIHIQKRVLKGVWVCSEVVLDPMGRLRFV